MKAPIFAVTAAALIALAGCDTQNQTDATIVGATGGAIAGGLATGSIAGAVAGGVVGGVAGNLVGKATDQPGQCLYRNSAGQTYKAACPENM